MNRGRLHITALFAAIAYVAPSSAFAQDDSESRFLPHFSGDIRLRYQNTNRDDFDERGDALTLRFKGSAEFDISPKTTFLIEIEGTDALIDDFNDGTNQNLNRPFIPDPQGIDLNRFQIISEIIPKTRATLGRQKIELDDWRFIGAFPFRQNDQTFDAVRIETTALGAGILDVAYFDKVLRPLGSDNPAGEFKGDSWYANYNLATPIGRVTAFHYALELETGPALALLDQSTQTTGVRVIGRRHWENLGIIWEGSYAVQSDHAGNPNDFKVDYGLAQISIEPKNFKFKARAEILGDDNGNSLQTPLASLHKFQGLSDQFLQTPPDGLRDYSLEAEYDWGIKGPFSNVSAFIRHHWFEASLDGRDYGTELDLSLSVEFNGVNFALEYADYDAQTFSADTKSLFFTTQYRF